MAETSLDRWRREVRAVLHDAPGDLVEEVAQHLSLRWDRLRQQGSPAAEADEQIRSELSAWDARARTPRVRLAAFLAGWGAEIRHAFRVLRLRPVFAAGMATLVALAVAAVASTFAVAYGLLWRPLPYPDGDRLAVIWELTKGKAGQVSFPDYRDLTAGSLFEASSAMSGGRGSLRVGDRIERVNALDLEPRGFAMLGASVIRGRLLGDTDAGQGRVLISERLWRSQLGSDPDIIGRPLWLSGSTLTVVGVLAAGFDFELPVGNTFRLEDHDIWRLLDPNDPFSTRRDVSNFEVLVRLRPGMSLESAQANVDAIGKRLTSEYAATNDDRTFRVAPLRGEVVGEFSKAVVLGAVAAAVTLAIALANLLTLASVRLSDRRSELAVRHALGAGAFRVRRQLATEYSVLVAAGTAAGVAVARWLVASVASLDAANLPMADAIRFDAPVMFAVGVVATVIAAALTFAAGRDRSSADALRSGSRTTGHNRRFRRFAIAGQLALTLALATAGSLLGLSLWRLMRLDPGFVESGLVTSRVSAFAQRYAGLEQVETFFRQVTTELGAQPGVIGVAAGSSLPLSGQTTGSGVLAEGATDRTTAGWQFVTPDYFRVVGMEIRRGRAFTADDRAHAGHVTIINESLARALFGDTDPVGRRVGVGGSEAGGDWHEVVGVVADVRHQSLDVAPAPRIYDLFGEHWGRTMFLVARTGAADPSSFLPVIRKTVALIDPEAPVFEGGTMAGLVRRSTAPRRLSAGIAIGLTAAALLLALVGIYAATSMSVSERTHEVGLRIALGASRWDALRLVLREGAITAVMGLIPGVACAIAAAGLIDAQLFNADSTDAVWVIPAIALVLLAAAIGAVVPPARRAALLDPLVAMRRD